MPGMFLSCTTETSLKLQVFNSFTIRYSDPFRSSSLFIIVKLVVYVRILNKSSLTFRLYHRPWVKQRSAIYVDTFVSLTLVEKLRFQTRAKIT